MLMKQGAQQHESLATQVCTGNAKTRSELIATATAAGYSIPNAPSVVPTWMAKYSP